MTLSLYSPCSPAANSCSHSSVSLDHTTRPTTAMAVTTSMRRCVCRLWNSTARFTYSRSLICSSFSFIIVRSFLCSFVKPHSMRTPWKQPAAASRGCQEKKESKDFDLLPSVAVSAWRNSLSTYSGSASPTTGSDAHAAANMWNSRSLSNGRPLCRMNSSDSRVIAARSCSQSRLVSAFLMSLATVMSTQTCLPRLPSRCVA
mmetsp:Transcript_16368/g.57270  ORF Transcript_16368/g.57270 Transcript_16368/m.57270 type:complete len:202 (-) Transcript_16368:147-752(-)